MRRPRERSSRSLGGSGSDTEARAGGSDHRPRICPTVEFSVGAGAHGVTLKLTRPCRPRTNGQAERFVLIVQDEPAYAREYRSTDRRPRERPRWLYRHDHRRPHGGTDGAAPTSRL